MNDKLPPLGPLDGPLTAPEPALPPLPPGQDGDVFLDFPRRVVVVRVRKPLDIAPTRIDLPMAIVKNAAAQILQLEAAIELQRGLPGPRLVK